MNQYHPLFILLILQSGVVLAVGQTPQQCHYTMESPALAEEVCKHLNNYPPFQNSEPVGGISINGHLSLFKNPPLNSLQSNGFADLAERLENPTRLTEDDDLEDSHIGIDAYVNAGFILMNQGLLPFFKYLDDTIADTKLEQYLSIQKQHLQHAQDLNPLLIFSLPPGISITQATGISDEYSQGKQTLTKKRTVKSFMAPLTDEDDDTSPLLHPDDEKLTYMQVFSVFMSHPVQSDVDRWKAIAQQVNDLDLEPISQYLLTAYGAAAAAYKIIECPSLAASPSDQILLVCPYKVFDQTRPDKSAFKSAVRAKKRLRHEVTENSRCTLF